MSWVVIEVANAIIVDESTEEHLAWRACVELTAKWPGRKYVVRQRR